MYGGLQGPEEASDPLELEFPPDVCAMNPAGSSEGAGSDLNCCATIPALKMVH